MTIQDGLKLKPTFRIPYYGLHGVEIPDTRRNDFPKFLYDMGCRVGVEIGVDRAHFGMKLALAGLKVYGVDPYMQYIEWKAKNSYRSHEDEARRNTQGLDYTIIKKTSMEALKDFEDESLDFVYIDGNHTLPYIAADIFGWERKLKKGGIMSGHDYAFVIGNREKEDPIVYDGTHVKAAVDACAYIMRVGTLYVLGKRFFKEGDVDRDKWRSWFWIKK